MDRNKKYWLDQPRNINKIVYALYIVCASLFLADLFYHKHGHFDFENWFGFYAWFGFMAYISIVMSAKLFRKIIKRKEDYYD
ncbi:MAG: hypothetical protein P8X88_01775 [Gammaproteobacteria bacterium]|jgi:hypothetical protein